MSMGNRGGGGEGSKSVETAKACSLRRSGGCILWLQLLALLPLQQQTFMAVWTGGGMRACIGDQCAVHEAKAPSARATASMMISVMRDPDNRVVLLLRLEENESSAYNREAHSLSSAPSKTFA